MMRLKMKKLLAIIPILLSASAAFSETYQEKFEQLTNYINAHAACSSYASSVSDSFSLAGFSSEDVAKNAGRKHLDLASSAAQELTAFSLNQKVGGQSILTYSPDGYCLGEMCFQKLEYVEAVLIIGALLGGQKEVDEKPLECPNYTDYYHPCSGGEPFKNQKYKAAELYKSKNCSLLMR